MNGVIIPVLIVFILSFTISLVIYFVGSVTAAKVKSSMLKLMPYSCGEELPNIKFQVNIRKFFLYIAFFMIFDVTAFILSLSFNGQGSYPILFAGIIVIGSLTCLPLWKGRD